MTLLYFLTLFPLVPALGMLLVRGDRARDAVGLIGSGIIMAVTVVVAVMFFGTGPQSFEVAPGTSHVLSIISSAIDVILCAVILYNAYKYRNALTTVLGIVQLVAGNAKVQQRAVDEGDLQFIQHAGGFAEVGLNHLGG